MQGPLRSILEEWETARIRRIGPPPPKLFLLVMAGATKREKKAAKFRARKAGLDDPTEAPPDTSATSVPESSEVAEEPVPPLSEAETSSGEAPDAEAPDAAARVPDAVRGTQKRSSKKDQGAVEGGATRTVFNEEGDAEQVTVAASAPKTSQKYILFVGAYGVIDGRQHVV